MLKIMGACFVAAASLMSGWASRQGMQQQLRLRRQLRLALELMQGEMELRMPPVAELFETVGQQLGGELGQFFQGTAVEMAAVTGRPPQTAMRLQLEKEPLPLEQEERRMLLELGGCLGRYDLTGQARALNLYKRQADGLIAAGEDTIHRRARASMTASVCAGLALIVILL